MPKIKMAETAQELKAKYQRKRMSSATAAQYHLYNYLYWKYLTNERKPVDYLKDKVLDDDSIVYTVLYDDMSAGGNAVPISYEYDNLCEWFNSSFEAAVSIRNSVVDYITVFNSEAQNAIAGENLRDALGEKANTKKISLWLSHLTMDALKPASDNYRHKSLRRRIESGLLYLNSYNTLIEIIAKQARVPEINFLQVTMAGVKRGVEILNETLEATREKIRKRGIAEDPQPSPYSAFTPEELETMLKEYSNILYPAPPIPQENLKRAEEHVKTILGATSTFTWSGAFSTIREEYWRR